MQDACVLRAGMGARYSPRGKIGKFRFRAASGAGLQLAESE